MTSQPHKTINQAYALLLKHFGPLEWWPAETPFEVAVGAILTQNTAWTNVEKAIINLKQANALSPETISTLSTAQLEELIRPSGFFRQKAVRLQHFARHLVNNFGAEINRLCAGPLSDARSRLLTLPGIGPETADSILLYAAERPSFVIDAYTRRIFERIGLLAGKESYDEIRALFMQALPKEVALYNEYHAQIVMLAKSCCHKRSPDCQKCPLRALCRFAHER